MRVSRTPVAGDHREARLGEVEVAAVNADGALVERVAREELLGEVEGLARLGETVLRREHRAAHALEDALDAEIARATRRERRAPKVLLGVREPAAFEVEKPEVAEDDAIAALHLQVRHEERERVLVVGLRPVAVARLEVSSMPHPSPRIASAATSPQPRASLSERSKATRASSSSPSELWSEPI